MEERTSTVDEVVKRIRSLGLSGTHCALVEDLAASLAQPDSRIKGGERWVKYLQEKPHEGEPLYCFLELEGKHFEDFVTDALEQLTFVTQRLRFEPRKWEHGHEVRVHIPEGLPQDMAIHLLKQILSEVEHKWDPLIREHLALRGKR